MCEKILYLMILQVIIETVFNLGLNLIRLVAFTVNM